MILLLSLLSTTLVVLYKILFILWILTISFFTFLLFSLSHDVYTLLYAVANDYPEVYIDMLENYFCWDLVEILSQIYCFFFWISELFIKINWNITFLMHFVLIRISDAVYFYYVILQITAWDWYYLIEMVATALQILNDSLVAIPLFFAHIHWHSSHFLYALLAFCCDLIVIIFFEDSQWIRSLFDNSFIKNRLRWYLPLVVLIIAALALIRACTPRYRYDYLSKIGWLKFFGIVLGIIIIAALIYYFW